MGLASFYSIDWDSFSDAFDLGIIDNLSLVALDEQIAAMFNCVGCYVFDVIETYRPVGGGCGTHILELAHRQTIHLRHRANRRLLLGGATMFSQCL